MSFHSKIFLKCWRCLDKLYLCLKMENGLFPPRLKWEKCNCCSETWNSLILNQIVGTVCQTVTAAVCTVLSYFVKNLNISFKKKSHTFQSFVCKSQRSLVCALWAPTKWYLWLFISFRGVIKYSFCPRSRERNEPCLLSNRSWQIF